MTEKRRQRLDAVARVVSGSANCLVLLVLFLFGIASTLPQEWGPLTSGIWPASLKQTNLPDDPRWCGGLPVCDWNDVVSSFQIVQA